MKLKARGSKPHAPRELMGRCEGWTHAPRELMDRREGWTQTPRELMGRCEGGTHGVAKRAGTRKAPAGRRGNASAGAKALQKK